MVSDDVSQETTSPIQIKMGVDIVGGATQETTLFRLE